MPPMLPSNRRKQLALEGELLFLLLLGRVCLICVYYMQPIDYDSSRFGPSNL